MNTTLKNPSGKSNIIKGGKLLDYSVNTFMYVE